ncbi:hypothetical protein SAMN05216474_2799 [Lishizhenia tianjinensis]|uniref:Uncharacterized protein n=1 Tax=Lishizhenia tianjinensis TaxID=477690 RepID=A0A1I7BG25_9FLAO|nr:hypothetical protein [Lishizhenia tianjinensis]SFT86072.1 hypothetical protein SAMN05216474_2799 [Lishizhenia tianjinensis]
MILEQKKLLEEFAKKHSLKERTIEGFKKNRDRCYKEDVEIGIPPLNGYPKDTLVCFFRSHSLIFERSYRYSPCIRTHVSICYKDHDTENMLDLECVGYYQLDVDENGESFDDWFVLESQFSPED